MIKVDLDQIKELRELTGAGIMDVRKALEAARGDKKKALALLKQKGAELAEKKKERTTQAGLVASYAHANGKIAALVELLCETDFVARNEEFQNLAHEMAMQVAAMNPKNAEELLKQEYIRDASKTIDDLVKEMVGKIRENVKVGRIQRFELGE